MNASSSTAAGTAVAIISSGAHGALAGWDAYLRILLRRFRFQIAAGWRCGCWSVSPHLSYESV